MSKPQVTWAERQALQKYFAQVDERALARLKAKGDIDPMEDPCAPKLGVEAYERIEAYRNKLVQMRQTILREDKEYRRNIEKKEVHNPQQFAVPYKEQALPYKD